MTFLKNAVLNLLGKAKQLVEGFLSTRQFVVGVLVFTATLRLQFHQIVERVGVWELSPGCGAQANLRKLSKVVAGRRRFPWKRGPGNVANLPKSGPAEVD